MRVTLIARHLVRQLEISKVQKMYGKPALRSSPIPLADQLASSENSYCLATYYVRRLAIQQYSGILKNFVAPPKHFQKVVILKAFTKGTQKQAATLLHTQ